MVRKIDLQHHLDLLQKAGLDPKTVTLAPLALAAMFTRTKNGNGAKPMAHLVVEGDESSTSVVLVDLGGTPRALRSIVGGLMMSDGSVVSEDAAAPILNSVRQTLLASGEETDQTEVIVAGAAATSAKVRGLLSDSLAMAVRDGGTFDYTGIFEGAMPGPNTGKYSSCLAMLLGELPTKPAELINFRQGEFMFRGRVRGDLSPFYTSGILAAALLAVTILHFSLGVSANLHRLNKVNAEIAAVARPVLGETDPADAKAQLQMGIAKMNKRLNLIGGNLTHSPLDTLAAVSRALDRRFPVQMTDVQIDSQGLRVTGQADSFATVDQAKRALDKSSYFGSIEVAHAKAGSDPSKVDFRMDANFKDAVPSSEREGDVEE